jgi:hypothetical protein
VQHRHLGHPAQSLQGLKPIAMAHFTPGLKPRPPKEKYTEHASPVTGHQSPVTSVLDQLKSIFGDRLYIEVQHLSAGDGRVVREAQRLGRELGIPLVATNNVHFVKPEEHLHHRAVNAIRTGGLLTTVAAPEITTGEAWFKPAAEMQRLFPDHPELLRATLEIADRCHLELALGKTIFPEFPVPEGESAFSRAETLPAAAARGAYAADARIGSHREMGFGAVFSAGVGHRGGSPPARDTGGSTRIGSQFDGAVLPGNFLCVPAALGTLF